MWHERCYKSMTRRHHLSPPNSPSDDADRAPIDAQVLAGLRAELDSDAALFDEILTEFINQLAPRLGAIDDAIGSADGLRTAAAAHALKGGSMLVGARGMSALCLWIELAGRAGAIDEAAALLERLREEAAAVRRALATARTV
jgi:HPt (histidine-containing phosphotransfer) domain-containing protein